MTTLTGLDAIEYAEQHELTLSKHADPTEGARDGLTVAEARELARQDPALVYLPEVRLLDTSMAEWLEKTR